MYKAPKSAVIFGGDGFIGSHLSKYLVATGCDVTTVDLVQRASTGANRQVHWDLRNPIPDGLIESPDVVFNLAAVHRTPGHPDREYYNTNIFSTLNILDWMERGGIETSVFTSSISVYGPGEDVKLETTLPAPVSPYGYSKLMAEEIHQQWFRNGSGRRLIIVRPAVIFGPRENGNFTRIAKALRQHRFMYPGRTDTVKACGYVEDLVRALIYVLGTGLERTTFNFCYPEEYTIEDICDAFHEVAGYDVPRTVPPPIVNASLAASRSTILSPLRSSLQRVAKLTESTRIVPKVLLTERFEWKTDIRSALEHWYNDPSEPGFA